MMQRLVVLLAIAASVAFAAEKRAAVWFVGGHGAPCGWELAGALDKAGFNLQTMHHPGLGAEPLTWEQVKKYNVLVITDLGQSNADLSLSADNRETIATLNRFLEAGGGILKLGAFGQQQTAAPPQTAFLEPLGLEPLFADMPVDPDAVAATSWRLPFALTRNIAASPITAGVEAFWYPVPPNRVGAQNHTITFTADDSWQIVVSGDRNSSTRAGKIQDNRPDAAGAYSHDVPLVAMREVGAGRFVYFAVCDNYVTGAHATTTLEGIVLTTGLEGVRSDGQKLLVQALDWLAAPSLAGDTLGGAPTNKDLLRNPSLTKFGTPFDWGKDIPFPAEETDFPGVIGARTAYSTGQGSADDWVAAAKAAGLSFLVFLEDFTALAADEFTQLKADCTRLSDETFAAVPGFVIDDEVGNHYFYFGSAFPYPPAHFLDAAGKVFRSRDPALIAGEEYPPGQLAMTVLDYAYSLSSFKLTCGNYLFSQDAAPFVDFFSDWDATAVVTLRNNQLLEDNTDGFLQLVDSGQGPVPLALNLVDAPAMLAASPWRTVLKFPDTGGTMVGGTRIRTATRLRDYWDSWHFYPDNPSRVYVTSGPRIHTWSYVGPRDYEGNSPGDFVWQNYRWRLRGHVSAAAGLREVAVYDGPTLFRRFLPAGQTDFTFELDLTHDRQHNLVLIVTDSAGNRAVGGEQWDRNHRAEEFMCADRNNELSYGYLTRQDGTGILLGGNQSLGTPLKRLGCGISPAGTFKNDAILGAPAFDGATGGEPQAFATVGPLSKEPVNSPSVAQTRRLFNSGDVHIGSATREYYFTDNIRIANVWHTLWRTAPATDFTIVRRTHFFQIDPDSPLAAFIWRIDLRLLRDLPNDGWSVIKLASSEDRLWTLRGSDGTVLSGIREPRVNQPGQWAKVPWGLDSYAALLDSPLGGLMAFPLSDGLVAQTSTPTSQGIMLHFDPEHSPRAAGDTATAEVLIVGIPRLTRYTGKLAGADTLLVDRFWRQFGLDDGAPEYTLNLAAGTVGSQRYLLRIDGSDSGAFAGTITGDLVSTLPIVVDGLAPEVSAWLYDDARKAARPIGVFEGQAWASVPVHGTATLFVGQPVRADVDGLFIQLTQTGETAWHLEVHNPTDQPVTAALAVSPQFPPLAACGWAGRQLDVPAGASVALDSAP